VVLISPSRFVQKKRLDELVELWRRIAAKGRMPPGAQLCLVGDPGPRSEHAAVSERIHGLARHLSLPGLRIFGSVPHHEMPRYYQGADGYISLSVQEGMSNALLEAMACALPVISPATESVLPLVRDGWNGFLFETGDPSAEEAAVERFLAAGPEERRRMGLRGRQMICRRHRIEQMAGRFEALFRELARAASEVHPCSLC
jgi:glycosyltransferase involved in cell wall biosynthesis